MSYPKKESFPEVSSESNLITDPGCIKLTTNNSLCSEEEGRNGPSGVGILASLWAPSSPGAHLPFPRKLQKDKTHFGSSWGPKLTANRCLHPGAQTRRLPRVSWACPELGKRPRSEVRLGGPGGRGGMEWKGLPKVQTKNLFA